MKVVISGSRSLKNLETEASSRLKRIISLNATILIGDAKGIDSIVQSYLVEVGYKDVIVYYAKNIRNNKGDWKTVCVNGSYQQRDRIMHDHTDFGLAIWDGRSPGTKQNIEQLGNRMRVVIQKACR